MKNAKYPRSSTISDADPTSSGGREIRGHLVTGGIAAGVALPFLSGTWTRPGAKVFSFQLTP